MMSLLTLLLAASPSMAQEGCDEPTTSAQLKTAMDGVVQGWVDLDRAAFMASSDAVRDTLPCLSDEVIRPVAAEIHRYEGLRAYMEGDPTAAAKHFAAARTVDPEYRFPGSMVPEGNPVLEIWNAIDSQQGATEPVPAPAQGRVQIDGVVAIERSVELPSVVQLFGPDGAISATAYLAAREPLPAYEVALPQKGAPLGLVAGAGGSAVVAAVLLGMAGGARARFHNDDTPFDQLEPLQKRANTMSTLGLVAGGAAVGLGTTAMIAGTF